MPVTTIYQSQHCKIDQAGIEVLDSERLESIKINTKAFKIGKTDNSSALQGDELAILISWGSMPNSAYRIQQGDSQAKLLEGTLVLPVEFIEPRPDMMAAQVIVTPCIILKTKKNDSIRMIRAGFLAAELG